MLILMGLIVFDKELRILHTITGTFANALSGMTRQEAAETAGMDRQTLGDWVHRFNADGVAGLADRPRSGRPRGSTRTAGRT